MKRSKSGGPEAPKKRLCGKASQREHLDHLHLRAQEVLESAKAQWASATTAAESLALEEEVQKRAIAAAQERHARAQEHLSSTQNSLENARRALEAAQREAERVEQAALLAEKQAVEAKQQLEADLQSSELRRSVAEEAARQRVTQENVMIFKLKSLFSQLGLQSPHGKQGVDCFINRLQQFLTDAGYPLRKPVEPTDSYPEVAGSQSGMEPAELAGESSTKKLSSVAEEPKPVAYFVTKPASEAKSGAVEAVPDPAQAASANMVLASDKVEVPTNPAASKILVMDGSGFRVQSTFPPEVAQAQQHELRQEVKAKEQSVKDRQEEKRLAEEAHLKLLADMEKKEEAARCAKQELDKELAKSRGSCVACATEVTKMQQLQETFGELSEKPEKAKPRAVKALKGPLQQMGLDEKQLHGLPETLAKKKGKRSPKERKFVLAVVEVLQAHVKSRQELHSKCHKEMLTWEAKIQGEVAEGKVRAKATEASSKSILDKEAQIKSAEEQLEATIQALKDHEAKMTSAGMLRFNSWSESCCICCDDVPVDSAAALGCGHGWYCPSCINRFVEARLDDGIAGDIPCPDCGKAICEEDLARLLPKHTIFRLHASNINRAAVASGAKPRPCPTPDCHMHKTFVDGTSGRETCPLCSKESCWWCGAQPYHVGMSCEQHRKKSRSGPQKGQEPDSDASFLQWMKETGTKQCPTCGMATSKENLEMQTDQVEECHKMMCRSCGTKFCFGCGAILTENYTCGCTQNAHNFVDPRTGELVKHLKKKEPSKAKAKARARR